MGIEGSESQGECSLAFRLKTISTEYRSEGPGNSLIPNQLESTKSDSPGYETTRYTPGFGDSCAEIRHTSLYT